MNSGRDDEEMEHDIKEFMNIILSEEDEQEYTDYRRYFSYDMEIVSRQGDQENGETALQELYHRVLNLSDRGAAELPASCQSINEQGLRI